MDSAGELPPQPPCRAGLRASRGKLRRACSPKHSACRNERVECVRELYARGAKLNAKNNAGWTPLVTAVTHGRLECVRELLLLGARVDAKDNLGFTALHTGDPDSCLTRSGVPGAESVCA